MRLTVVHLFQVKRREADDDGEDEEGSGTKLVSSSAAVLLDHIRPDLFQVRMNYKVLTLLIIFCHIKRSQSYQSTFLPIATE